MRGIDDSRSRNSLAIARGSSRDVESGSTEKERAKERIPPRQNGIAPNSLSRARERERERERERQRMSYRSHWLVGRVLGLAAEFFLAIQDLRGAGATGLTRLAATDF